jgi:hypothetical protein
MTAVHLRGLDRGSNLPERRLLEEDALRTLQEADEKVLCSVFAHGRENHDHPCCLLVSSKMKDEIGLAFSRPRAGMSKPRIGNAYEQGGCVADAHPERLARCRHRRSRNTSSTTTHRPGRQDDCLDIGSLDLTGRGDVDRAFCQEN